MAGAQATAGKEKDIEAPKLGKATRSLKKQNLPAILSAVVHGVTVIPIHARPGAEGQDSQASVGSPGYSLRVREIFRQSRGPGLREWRHP